MKILEVCNFSAGTDGVFARVREESIRLAERGHEVRIFSSNLIKGKKGFAEAEDKIGKVKVQRFEAKKIGGESFMKWDFESAEKEALKYNPQVIIAHSYRHSHTIWALNFGKKIGAKVFLVTHAPFARTESRSIAGSVAVGLYDYFVGPGKLKNFEKVIAIAKWEIPYLKKLGLKEQDIVYIPNGISEEFFNLSAQAQEERKILFLGRIARIKNLETAIKSLFFLEDKSIKLEIVGPAEEDYLRELKDLIWSLRLHNRVVFSPTILDLKEKIKKIDSAEIFILPSKSEGMPQALVEAMARGKIVIVSDNLGNKDIVKDGDNGLLFKVGDEAECSRKIGQVLRMNRFEKRRMGWNARKSVENFSWKILIRKIEEMIK